MISGCQPDKIHRMCVGFVKLGDNVKLLLETLVEKCRAAEGLRHHSPLISCDYDSTRANIIKDTVQW